MITKLEHREEAEKLLTKAKKLMVDEAYVKLHGYTEITTLLRMSNIHLELSKR